MSEALIWHLIRDNNSFLVKRGRTTRDGSVQFSSEPGNLMNVNTFKYSGIANERTIDISTNAKHQVVLKTKTGKELNKPNKAHNSSTFTLNVNKSSSALKGLADSSFRSDLASAAKARYLKNYREVRILKGVIKGARKATKRDSR